MFTKVLHNHSVRHFGFLRLQPKTSTTWIHIQLNSFTNTCKNKIQICVKHSTISLTSFTGFTCHTDSHRKTFIHKFKKKACSTSYNSLCFLLMVLYFLTYSPANIAIYNLCIPFQLIIYYGWQS